MRDPDLADDLGPERERAVDPPVADADDPEREQKHASPVIAIAQSAAAGRQQRDGRDEERRERRPDEVVADHSSASGPGKRVLPVEEELRLRVELVVEVDGERAVAARRRTSRRPRPGSTAKSRIGKTREQPAAHAVTGAFARLGTLGEERDGEDYREDDENPGRSPGVPGPDPRPLEPPGRKRKEPHRRQPRAPDRECNRRTAK